MKMLVHRIRNSVAAPFSFEELKQYLRIDSTCEDTVIEAMGRTAADDIEHLGQIALLFQTVRVTVFNPARHVSYLHLPVGPAPEAAAITVTIDGAPYTDFEFSGGNRPFIHWLDPWHDLSPGRLTVEYQAGFGDTAADIPSDLAIAIMDQAAVLFDGRGATDAKALAASPHMARIGARYRGVSM